jgi:mRNA-degrading endonuclease toxin of MazEF toxin-antitoxin module
MAAEVPLDHVQLRLDGESAVNCDGLHTVPQTMLTEFVAVASRATMKRVCAGVSYALG